MEGPTSHFYFSQRLKLHYVDWGNESAPPLLLVHGGRDHCRSWDWVAERLRDRYHVIAPDLRGHGDSAWAVGGDYELQNYLYDLAQLAFQKEAGPVTIIAHSLGANVSLSFCGIFPDKVKKLVAIEGLGPPPQVVDEEAAMAVEDRFRSWIETRRENARRTPRKYRTLEEATARMAEANPRLTREQAQHLTIYGAYQNEDGTYSWKFDDHARAGVKVHRFPVPDTHHLWTLITAPVLLARGVESWARDPELDGRILHFRNAQLINFENAGHWVHHDRLDAFMEAVDTFLAE